MSVAPLRLRPVRAKDSGLLFAWANDITTRQMSFSGSAIEREDHERWLELKLARSTSRLYMITDANGDPVGQLRFEIDAPDEATVSISIAPEHRRKGFAAEALCLAKREAQGFGEVDRLRAFIKPENTASVASFAKAGFEPPVEVCYRGHPALCMLLHSH